VVPDAGRKFVPVDRTKHRHQREHDGPWQCSFGCLTRLPAAAQPGLFVRRPAVSVAVGARVAHGRGLHVGSVCVGEAAISVGCRVDNRPGHAEYGGLDPLPANTEGNCVYDGHDLGRQRVARARARVDRPAHCCACAVSRFAAVSAGDDSLHRHRAGRRFWSGPVVAGHSPRDAVEKGDCADVGRRCATIGHSPRILAV